MADTDEAEKPIKAFHPVGDKVLVLRDGTPDTVGSIVIPEVAKESERPFWCTVVAVGLGGVTPTNKTSVGGHEVWTRKPMWVKPGDRVLINRYEGPRVSLNGVEHLCIEHTDIKAIVDP